ncbi:ADP-ribosylation factor GTPase-activating protein 1 [Biomphalaria pfeifferi]|uniref:ADP-ribosylation factor GTPase-activating protein 1 n=1 Tax=Biomphalaria pfeifferi TaxID=112525 RepID=A0AAD8FP06_BIOPF|nr:ADP-ribosylation factor GTPase-activating protein 1 [Biomphalaria pfeifferi]
MKKLNASNKYSSMFLEQNDSYICICAAQLASTTAQKTKELGATVSENVIKPTAEKVKEGQLLNEVGTSMSGLASKLSAAGTKGWKDLQSLWSEPKTTLTSADTSPGEKSSLLSRSSYGSGEDSSKSHLLAEDDESWGEWGQDSDWSSKKSNKQNSDWSAGNEDDLEAWLNDDKSTMSSSTGKVKSKKKAEEKKHDDDWDTWRSTETVKSSVKCSSSATSKSKKKSQKSTEDWDNADWNTGFSESSSKQKQPLVGNLLDLDDGNGLVSSGAGDGWDNEVWAEDKDEDDEWQTLDLADGNKTR